MRSGSWFEGWILPAWAVLALSAVAAVSILTRGPGEGIWLIFFQTYLPRALRYPSCVPLAALLVAVVGVRVLAWGAGRPRAAAAEAGA